MKKNKEISFKVENQHHLLEHVFKQYHGQLCSYAFKFVQNVEVAKDMVQDAFLAVLKSLETGKVDNLNAYLYRAVRNNCLNYIKHLEIRNSFEEEEKKRVLREIEYYEENQTLMERELHQKITRLIDELPPKYKTVFKMSRFEGLKNKEIADKLNLSVRTVETQLYRALLMLRDKVKNQSIGLFFMSFAKKMHFF